MTEKTLHIFVCDKCEGNVQSDVLPAGWSRIFVDLPGVLEVGDEVPNSVYKTLPCINSGHLCVSCAKGLVAWWRASETS